MNEKTEWRVISEPGAAIEVRAGKIPKVYQDRISQAIREGHAQRELDRKEAIAAIFGLMLTLLTAAGVTVLLCWDAIETLLRWSKP